ncbi:hypothetical protein HY495_02155 [Candidatus Woesearchaeota archaeon]|nr:hypothetical protein [Candidatus Woesearchaeota archaeon]
MVRTATEGRTPEGLIVPPGLERTLTELNSDNQKFLKFRDTLHLKSLTGAVTERYLASVRVERDGVAYYEPKGKETHPDLAAMIMNELDFHLHRRVYQDMTAELYEQLRAVKDPTTGESYTHTVTKTKFGVDANALKQAFDENGATLAIVSGITDNLGSKWSQRELGGAIRHKYGDDPAKYEAGIENFRTANLGIGEEFTPERLTRKTVDELLGVYVGLVDQALEKTHKAR